MSLNDKTFKTILGKWYGVCFILMLTYGLMISGSIAHAEAEAWKIPPKKKLEDPSFFSQSIRTYQKIISRSDGDRCPMYPSCSAYARQAFQTHGLIKGWILTSDRLLRCGHDEVHLSGRIQINGKYVTPDPLNKNDFLFK
ncbi:MAG: membrane protein insertion efficiency factor YidD [Desulfobacteraceae bacterium]